MQGHEPHHDELEQHPSDRRLGELYWRNTPRALPISRPMNGNDQEQTLLLRAIWNEMKALGANLGGRIDQTNARLDQTNARLDRVVETMDRRFGETHDRIGAVEGVLRDLAGQQLPLGRFVRNLVDGDLVDIRDRLARVEAKIAG